MKILNKKIISLVVLVIFGLTGMTWAQGTIDLPKTGQTTSYAPGDDGDLQMGVDWPVPRFIDHRDGTITDSLTGLMWTKNANLLGQSKTYQEALDYVSAMNAGDYQNFGYTDWRMPNIVEIESLINAEQSNNATWLNSYGFTNVPKEDPWWFDFYWLSGSGGAYTKVIWLYDGRIIGTYKTYFGLLWPVRSARPGTIQLPKTGITWSEAEGDDGDLQIGVDWPDPRFNDNRDGTVTDNLTGLIWTKSANLPNGRMTWQEALNYVASLNGSQYLGHSDWRLPNRKELRSLVDHSKFGPPLPSEHPFTNISGSSRGAGYWSSSTFAYDPSKAWGVWLLWAGEVTGFEKTSQCYVWPVCAGELRSCIEKSSTESTLVETLLGKKAILNNATVTGDFESILDFTKFGTVNITTGPFAGKGFSKGECQTTLEGISYTGNWKGVLFFKPQERKVYLKGTVSGEISAIVEGYLTESIPESDIYDRYQATWKIGRLGDTVTSATINLKGTLTYQDSSEYPLTELYFLQTNLEGDISGHYAGSLNTVLSHLRVISEDNPYSGEGFSIISYASESGSGEGWTYDKIIAPGKLELRGMFTSPLLGVVSATLDETVSPRALTLTIERIDLGLPPAPELAVKVWGPTRVSPGQTINYIIEYRNDGLKGAEETLVFIEFNSLVEHIDACEGAYYNPILHNAGWDVGKLPAKTSGYLSAKVRLPWGLPQGTTLETDAIITELLPHGSQENLGLNGIGTIMEEDPETGKYKDYNTRKWKEICDKENAKPEWLYKWEKAPSPRDLLERLGMVVGDVKDIYLISPYNPQGPTFNERNGKDVPSGYRPKVIAFSGGTRSAISLIKRYLETEGKEGIITDELILISPMLTSSDELRKLITNVRQIKPNFKIVICQSPKDDIFPDIEVQFPYPYIDPNGKEWILEIDIDGRIRGNLAKINWKDELGNVVYTKEFYIQGDNSRDGLPFESEEGIEVKSLTGTHGELIKEYNNLDREGKENMSSSTPHIITTARDPNEKLVSPEGDIKPGDRLDYTIKYENEGEGIAFGVYITDTLDEDLNDTTLTVNDNGSYDPKTRTITWFIGEVGPGQEGSVTFSVNVKDDTQDKAEIINFATVYFPSVPEATRTNGTVNRVITITDNIPPTTTATISPSPNPAGWNNTNVTITLTATDNQNGSGVKEIHYRLAGAEIREATISADTAQVFLTTEGVTTLTYWTVDNAGNIESQNSLTVKLDKIPPTITTQLSPQPNSHSWNNTDVTVTFSATDNLSGVATVTQPATVTTEGANQHIGGEAVDLAGNRATTYVILNIDRIPPTVNIIATPDILWPPNHKLTDVTIGGSSQDNLSGIASSYFKVTDEYKTTEPSIPCFNSTIKLESWRAGNDLDGRVYIISVTTKDKADNETSSSTTVICPHDQGKKWKEK